MSVTSEYLVSGMTCGHCVASVTEEVSTIPGVTDVQVDLGSGDLVITSDTSISFEAVEAAVDEAGYSVTPH
jgi:copper chaperone CopZ